MSEVTLTPLRGYVQHFEVSLSRKECTITLSDQSGDSTTLHLQHYFGEPDESEDFNIKLYPGFNELVFTIVNSDARFVFPEKPLMLFAKDLSGAYVPVNSVSNLVRNHNGKRISALVTSTFDQYAFQQGWKQDYHFLISFLLDNRMVSIDPTVVTEPDEPFGG